MLDITDSSGPYLIYFISIYLFIFLLFFPFFFFWGGGGVLSLPKGKDDRSVLIQIWITNGALYYCYTYLLDQGHIPTHSASSCGCLLLKSEQELNLVRKSRFILFIFFIIIIFFFVCLFGGVGCLPPLPIGRK